jgi:hypothetical protein
MVIFYLNKNHMKMEYIYLIQEREFIKTQENVYKVGMTKQPNLARFKSYPIGSTLLLHIVCNNCRDTEAKILTLFRKTYKSRTDIGSEYFEGNYTSMISHIYSIVLSSFRDKSEAIENTIPEVASVVIPPRNISKVRTYKSIIVNLANNYLKSNLMNKIISPVLLNGEMDFSYEGLEWEFNIRDNSLFVDIVGSESICYFKDIFLDAE